MRIFLKLVIVATGTGVAGAGMPGIDPMLLLLLSGDSGGAGAGSLMLPLLMMGGLGGGNQRSGSTSDIMMISMLTQLNKMEKRMEINTKLLKKTLKLLGHDADLDLDLDIDL